MSTEEQEHTDGHASEDHPEKPDAEGGKQSSANVPPGLPADDDSPLGDTDQHSDA